MKTAPFDHERSQQVLSQYDTGSLELEPIDEDVVFVPVDHRQREAFDWSDLYARH